MVVLKKIKSSTLMETLVATILIVIIFVLASMILNNLFSSTIKNNTKEVENHLNELQYLQQHQQLQLPYVNTFQNWEIAVGMYKDNGDSFIEFEAVNIKTNKIINITQAEGH